LLSDGAGRLLLKQVDVRAWEVLPDPENIVRIVALPCLALPCLALPCLALPCLALPCRGIHSAAY